MTDEIVAVCKLCFLQSNNSLVNVNSPSQINKLTILNILTKHIDIEIEPTNVICFACWNKVYDFHLFYLRVKQVQRISIDKNLVVIKEEIESNRISENDTELSLNNTIANTFDSVEESLDISYFKPTINQPSKINKINKNRLNQIQSTNDLSKSIEIISNKKSIDKVNNDKLISNHYPQIYCQYCNDIFTKFSVYKEHCYDVHKKKEWIILCCNKKIKRMIDMLEHIELHENPDLFKCLTCEKQCTSKKLLKAHTQMSHLEKPKSCDICGKEFKNKHVLASHISTIHSKNKDKTFVCKCGKRYKTKSMLSAHQGSAHQKIICDICAKVENGKSSLRQHMITYHTERPPRIQCIICKSWHRDSVALRLHNKNHHTTLEVPLNCPQCKKTFTKIVGLRSHIHYHHKDRNRYPCHLCTKSFFSTIKLKEHVATHTGVDLYTCDYCPRTFKASNNIIKHKKARHAIEYEEEKIQRANGLLFNPPLRK